MWICFLHVFFFQAEDGIRDADVTGVQTCALPILAKGLVEKIGLGNSELTHQPQGKDKVKIEADIPKIGRASCRERV